MWTPFSSSSSTFSSFNMVRNDSIPGTWVHINRCGECGSDFFWDTGREKSPLETPGDFMGNFLCFLPKAYFRIKPSDHCCQYTQSRHIVPQSFLQCQCLWHWARQEVSPLSQTWLWCQILRVKNWEALDVGGNSSPDQLERHLRNV